MITHMRNRIARYRLNLGTGGMVWNLLLLAFLTYLIVNASSPTARIAMSIASISGAVCGLLILPARRTLGPKPAWNAVRVVWWGLLTVVALSYFKLVDFPPMVWLGVLFAGLWNISASFWLSSEPDAISARGYETLLRQAQLEEDRRSMQEN